MPNLKPLQVRLSDCKVQAPSQLVNVRAEIKSRYDEITHMLQRYNSAGDGDKQFKISGAFNNYILFNSHRDVDMIAKIIGLLGDEAKMLQEQLTLLDAQIAMVNQVAESAFAVVAAK